MKAIRAVPCGDSYTAAATIEYQYEGSGGYFQVATNSVYMQLLWGKQGGEQWTNEILADPCNGSLSPGIIGIRFRNAVAGQVAVVSAGLSLRDEPSIVALPG